MTTRDLPELESQSQMVLRLRHLFEVSSPCIFLSGNQGSGKTHLCELLLTRFDPPWRVAYLTYLDKLSLPKAREALIQQLLINPVFDPADTLGDSLFRLLGSEPIHLLLVVDDAHLAPDEFIDELWDFLCINDALPISHKIGVLFCGHSEWGESGARRLQGREGSVLELEIEPLGSREQTRLLEFYLRTGGVVAHMPNPAALADRLRSCAGNPGRIVALAESIMDKKSLLKLKELPTNKLVATGAVVVGGILLLSWVLPPLLSTNPATPGGVTTEQTMVSAAEGTVISAAQSVNPVPDSGALPAEPQGDLTAEEGGNGETRRVVIADQVVKDIMASQKNGTAPAASGAVDSASAGVSGAVTSVQQLPALAQKLKGHEVSGAATSAAVTSVAKPAPTVKPSQPKVEAKPVASKSGVAAGTGNLAELKQKPARHYTLQLSAGPDLAALKQSARQLSLPQTSWVYQTEYQGKPWFVLIQGDYATSAQAKAAIATLPAQVKRGAPWPKSFAQVQKEIK